MNAFEAVVRAVLTGIGGTIALDLWALVLARGFKVAGTNWALVGRWIGNMPYGRYVHESMMQARPIRGEAAIGWTFHYMVGAGYGLLLLLGWGDGWFEAPTLLPPMILAWLLLVLPYFIMMPGMGSGVAGARTPKPWVTRLKSAIGHSIFGLGLYATATVLA